MRFSLILWVTSEQHPVRQHDSQDAVGLQVVQLMQQEGIVCLALRRNAIVLEAGIQFSVRGVPMLRVWWIRYHGIHIKRSPGIRPGLLYRPILIQ